MDRLVQKNFLLTNLDPLPVLVDASVIAKNSDQEYFNGISHSIRKKYL